MMGRCSIGEPCRYKSFTVLMRRTVSLTYIPYPALITRAPNGKHERPFCYEQERCVRTEENSLDLLDSAGSSRGL